MAVPIADPVQVKLTCGGVDVEAGIQVSVAVQCP
jgi:hypothetical protein